MFWLLFVFIIGLFIILTSINLEVLAKLIQRCLPNSNEYARLEWRANHVLHLLHLAYEEQRHPGAAREWDQGSWDIPITTANVKLAAVKEDKGLPRLIGCTEHDFLGMGPASSAEGVWCDEEPVVFKVDQSHMYDDGMSDHTLNS